MIGGIARIALRVLVAGCLIVDAVVHLRLAHGYQLGQPSGVGEGTIFRTEAVVALLTAAWVLVRGSRPAYAAAFVIGLSACAAVVLYRYVDVGPIGPIPSMYEPVWFGQKTLSAVAEGAAAVLALWGLLATGRHRRARHARDLED